MVDYSNGLYFHSTGHSQRALDHFRRAITALHAIGEVANLYTALFHTAPLLRRSDPVRAARVAGAALAIAARVGLPPGQRLRQAVDRLQAELGARLGMEQARAAWSQGEQLSVDEAVALALEDGHRENTGRFGLSARELQVAELVARGLTSSQVANSLNLSPRTVDNHLARIFSKLGLSKRLQLATWFVTHGYTSNERE